VNQEFGATQSVPLPERLPRPSPSYRLITGVLDSFSFALFGLSFLSLTHLLGSWCRFLAEE